jgi:Protein of unknown function (DUF3500)
MVGMTDHHSTEAEAVAIAAAASDWLTTLDAGQRSAAVWPFESAERGDWHYAPRVRDGLPLRAMHDEQRDAAHRLLAATLSAAGERKARAIMALEDVLDALEGGRRPGYRDPLNYAFTVFGDPATPPWGWRIEGHHLIVNVSLSAAGAIAATPTFWGANPARIPSGAREGQRTLEAEYRLGIELAQTLSPSQRSSAVFAIRSVGNIVAERGRARALGEPSGLLCGELDGRQLGIVEALLAAYIDNLACGLAAAYRRDALGDVGAIRLAWAGGMAEGEPFYYRLHGPRLLVEFDCTPDDANHIHSVWRDPANDWGRDILGEHYRHHHDDD